MRKWEKQTSEAPLRETSPPVLGSSPIGGVEHGKKRSSSRKNVKNSSNPIFQVSLPFFPQGPQELLQKRLQTDATWHNLKILTEPQGMARYEKDLWNARSKPENIEKRGNVREMSPPRSKSKKVNVTVYGCLKILLSYTIKRAPCCSIMFYSEFYIILIS